MPTHPSAARGIQPLVVFPRWTIPGRFGRSNSDAGGRMASEIRPAGDRCCIQGEECSVLEVEAPLGSEDFTRCLSHTYNKVVFLAFALEQGQIHSVLQTAGGCYRWGFPCRWDFEGEIAITRRLETTQGLLETSLDGFLSEQA